MADTLVTNSAQETRQAGKKLAASLCPGAVIALIGELGSGKTCFTQGLGQGLDVTMPVTSPTFTIMQQYPGRLPVYHFDFYRLNTPEEIADLGFDEFINDNGVCIIEWAEKCLSLLPEQRTEITFDIVDENTRKIIISH